MKLYLNIGDQNYMIDTNEPLDISLPLTFDRKNVTAWGMPPPEAKPIVAGKFVGSVEKGAPVNFFTYTLAPHAHGTHTECVGHITEEMQSIQNVLKHQFYIAKLITVDPEKIGEDKVLTVQRLKMALEETPQFVEALIIRTLPNSEEKKYFQYSGKNPVYIHHDAMDLISDMTNILHLLVDMPSVDREEDQGKLLAHKIFWLKYPQLTLKRTITELIYVDNMIVDGIYLLHLGISPGKLDAVSSRPVIYSINPL